MHIYTHDNIKFFPSVTTITGYFKDLEAFESLMNWSNFLGYKHIKYSEALNKKANFGTAIHKSIECILNEKEIPNMNDSLSGFDDLVNYRSTMAMFDNFMKKMNVSLKDTIFSEETMLDESLGYAGTADWVLRLNNETVLIDFKTSSKVHESMGLQLSAYRELLRTCKNISIDTSYILLLNQNKWHLVEHNNDLLDKCYEKFCMYHELFNLYVPDCKSVADTNTIIRI